MVIGSYGFNRRTIYKWMSMVDGSGNDLRALTSTRGAGRPRSLTAAQERQVFRWVNGRDPRQHGLDFGLWTRAIVALLIKRRFGIALGVSSVGSLLAKLQLTPQKPRQRAYQRDPETIALWQKQTYPALARRAKRDSAQILFWDDSGFRADTVYGKTWGLRGQTPIVYRPGQRQLISAASAVDPRGEFWFCTYAGGLNGELVVALLRPIDVSTKAARPVDSRWSTRTQDPPRSELRGIDHRQNESTFLTRVCPGLDPGRIGLESRQTHRHGPTAAATRREARTTHRSTARGRSRRSKARPIILPNSFRSLYS